jgi:hypothetical protein
MAKTAAIGIRVEPERHAAANAAARSECRSVASYIIAGDIQRKGLLPLQVLVANNSTA